MPNNNDKERREIISFLTGLVGIMMGIALVVIGVIISVRGSSVRADVLQNYGEYKYFVGGTLIILGLHMTYKIYKTLKTHHLQK